MVSKVLLVGAGHRGRELLSLFRKVSGTVPCEYHVYDPYWDESRSNLDDVCAELAARRMATEEYEGIKKGDFKYGIVSVVNVHHAEHAVKLLKAGTAVYLEKPMAVTKDQLKEVWETHLSTGTPLVVGHVLRSAPWFSKLWHVVARAKLGPLRQVQASETLWPGHGVLANHGWRGTAAQSGGHLLEKVVHLIDLIVCLFDADGACPRKVQGFGRRGVFVPRNPRRADASVADAAGQYGLTTDTDPYVEEKDVDDTLSLNMLFTGGRTAQITAASYGRRGGRHMRLIFEGGEVVVDCEGYKVPRIEVWKKDFSRGGVDDTAEHTVYEFPVAGCHGNGDTAHMQDFFTVGNAHAVGASGVDESSFVATAVAIELERSVREGGELVDLDPFFWDMGFTHRVQNYPSKRKDKCDGMVANHTVLKFISTTGIPGLSESESSEMCEAANASFVLPVDTEGNVYAIQHKKREMIDIIGGHRNKDETNEECAVRECMEESGIKLDVSDLRLVGFKTMNSDECEDPAQYKYPLFGGTNVFYAAVIEPQNLAALKVQDEDEVKAVVKMPTRAAIANKGLRVHYPFVVDAAALGKVAKML